MTERRSSASGDLEARVRVRAAPGARQAGVLGRYGDAWKVRVRSAPDRGRANDELERVLAEALGLPRGAVRIERGHSSRDKWFRIVGLASAHVEERLAEAARVGRRSR